MAFNPKYLLLGPPVVWSIIGLTALMAPGQIGHYFYIFWPLNDGALMMALIGILLMVFNRAGPTGPPAAREWAVAAPETLAAMPTEDLLRLAATLARRGR